MYSIGDIVKVGLTKEDKMMQAAEKKLLPKMAKTGREYMVAYDAAGKQIFQKAGSKKSIGFTAEEGELMRGSNFYHSHPNDSAFSSADFVTARLLEFDSMNVTSEKYNYTLKSSAKSTWGNKTNIETEYKKIKAAHTKPGQVYYDALRADGLDDAQAQRIAWAENTHSINLEMAEKFNLEYERKLR